jgi:hypothetical protein
MSFRSGFDPEREAKAEFLALLEKLLGSGVVTSAHYVGYAHESILRLLQRHLGTGFSVMDMPDRFHTGAAFFWEEDYPYPHERPNWLEGVKFYQEGCPRADLFIRDVPWGSADPLSAIINLHPPTYVLLADEAIAAATHPAYTWTVLPACALGKLRRDDFST